MHAKKALQLIKHPAVSSIHPSTWADFGSGTGLFTHALSFLLAPGSRIIAVDKNIRAFERRQQADQVKIEKLQADFTDDLIDVSELDGILMANSLHFVSNKIAFLRKLNAYFRHEACFLVVEYDTDAANDWVPYPISFQSIGELFVALGFSFIEKIDEVPSRYNRSNIYSVLIKR